MTEFVQTVLMGAKRVSGRLEIILFSLEERHDNARSAHKVYYIFPKEVNFLFFIAFNKNILSNTFYVNCHNLGCLVLTFSFGDKLSGLRGKRNGSASANFS